MTAVGSVVKQMKVGLHQGAGSPVEYNTATLYVREVPTRDTQTATVASGESITDVGPTTWAVEVGFHTSYVPGSLHRLLLDNDGETATLTWEPDPLNDPGRKRTGTVVLVAPSSDYTVGAFASGSVQLPVQGALTTVDPT